MANEKPLHRVSLGRIRAAIWLNVNEQGQRYFRTNLVRHYRNGDEWLESSNYFPEELPLVAQVAQMACAWMCEHQHLLTQEEPAEL